MRIIRTWAFYTISKSYFHHKSIPWKHIAISGWVVDPSRTKMSKSKGNVVTPEGLMSEYSTDGVRYWAGKAKLGQDTVFDENTFKQGQRLATKIYNAAKFVMIQVGDIPFDTSLEKVTCPVDQAWLGYLSQIHSQVTKSLNHFEHTRALECLEQTFWSFCDNYLELVKDRAYKLKHRDVGLSGVKTLDQSLFLFLKMFAPYLPYVTEEVWSHRYTSESASVHRGFLDRGGGYEPFQRR